MQRERTDPKQNRVNPRVVKRKMSKWKKKRPEHRQLPPLKKTFQETVVMTCYTVLGLTTMTDLLSETHELIDRAGPGDEAARQNLLERYRDYLRRMVAVRLDHRLAARVDPSDVVQETLIDAARRLDDTLRERPLPFYGRLRQLAGERVINTHRRQVTALRRSVSPEHRELDLPDNSADELVRRLSTADTSPSNQMMRRERHERLKAALASLPPRDREVLVMRHLVQLSTAEIAAMLEISEPAVKSRLLCALIRMREQMGDPT
jgi:RNA polymerase sigma-70 factor (ECF subfamily)